MRFGDIVFDPAIGDALRRGRLVIFAGAGVSMGPPARMPGYLEMARRISVSVK